METFTTPIFYDPKELRWHRIKLITRLLIIILIGIFGVLTFSIIISPTLPAVVFSTLSRATGNHHLMSPKTPTPTPLKTIVNTNHNAKALIHNSLPTATPTPVASPFPIAKDHSASQMIGFYVNWDDTSFTSLKYNVQELDKLIPEWVHLDNVNGDIRLDDPAKQAQVLKFLQAKRPNLPIVPLINNFASEQMTWEDTKLSQMLANKAARANLIKNLLNYVQQYHFAGISIDFENLPTNAQPNLNKFIVELYAEFHPLGLEVSQSVPFDDPEFDYQQLAKSVDYLILMAYDEHWSESSAGAIASQKWFSEGLKRRFAQLPGDKLVVAIGNYGYDWPANTNKGEEISFQEAIKTAQESEGKIALDEVSLNPTFDYYDDNDKLHHVWFLDAVTSFNEMAVSQTYQPRGFALWRLGAEDPSIWPIVAIRHNLDQSAANNLKTIQYGYDLDYEGSGEILKVTDLPSTGARTIKYDEAQSLVVDEHLTAFPSSYVITRWGGVDPKKIALTFDDGPDPAYTPQVLDILKRYHVPATFFVVGNNANQNQQLLKRIFNEGNEIGNHTFTHPNISMISDGQLKAEINSTQRLMESLLGHQTLLFRPPYAEDVEPETPDQVKPLATIGEYGYYTIGMQIDPNDWRTPGVDQIVQETIDQISSGQGNIVLLHDSGGDRSQTIAALPSIIEKLQAKGYQLVTISDLMKVSRDAVMPAVSAPQIANAYVDEVGFTLINLFGKSVKVLFGLGIFLGVLRLLMVMTLAIRQKVHWHNSPTTLTAAPFVSVIVPAYNEEKVICQTIDSLLQSDYEHFNIIVVDDGSKDGTFARVQAQYGNHPKVKAFTKPNGGKALALNFGIAQTDAEVVICLDADTVFKPNAISKLVRHFTDPQIGAVAGNAKVGNRINLLTRWQALEYITSQNLDRRAFDQLNCITVVPGAIGAWRRNLVIQAGGFTHDTLAEDADLTLSILKLGYRVIYEERAIALTEAPDTVSGFIKQRFRWTFGTLQAIWKHRSAFLSLRYRALGMLAIPNVLVFQIFFPLISPIMDLLMLTSLGDILWQRYQHPNDYSTDGFQRVLGYYLLFVLVDLLAAVVAFALERKEQWRLILWLFFQRFCYRQLLYIVAVRAFMAALRGTMVGWGKLERKATVHMEA